jgi:hypothetical protein
MTTEEVKKPVGCKNFSKIFAYMVIKPAATINNGSWCDENLLS